METDIGLINYGKNTKMVKKRNKLCIKRKAIKCCSCNAEMQFTQKVLFRIGGNTAHVEYCPSCGEKQK